MREQHDVSKIQLPQVFDAAEMGVNTAEGALRRLAADTSTGRVAIYTAGELPWSGLGVNTEDAVKSGEAIRHASMDWLVEKRKLCYVHGYQYVESQDDWAVVRCDTGAQLGSVKGGYVPLQNLEGFEFLDAVLAEHGAVYESAGSLYGGRKVFMLARFDRYRFDLGQDDVNVPYVAFTNAHDGTESGWCYPTSTRIVCGNTFRVAQSGKERGIRLLHRGNLKTRIADAQRMLGIAVTGFAKFQEAAEVLVRKQVNPVEYFNSVLDGVCEVTAEQVKLGAEALVAQLGLDANGTLIALELLSKKFEKRSDMLTAFLESYSTGRCFPQGSAWAAFNAITDYADHRMSTPKSRDRAFEYALHGHWDSLKQTAFELAV